jgi:hypothetical protein
VGQHGPHRVDWPACGLRSRSARKERGRGGRSAGGREGAPPGRGGSGRAAEAWESESDSEPERGAGSRGGPGRQASGEGSRRSPCSAAPRAGELVPLARSAAACASSSADPHLRPRPRGSCLQRRENAAGGRAARGPPGGGDGGSPRHHVRRPRAPSLGPGPSPAAWRALRVARGPRGGGGGGAGRGAAFPAPRALARRCLRCAALRWTSFAKLPGPYAAQMCDLIEPQPAEKIGKMKKLRRTLSESFSRIGECSRLSPVSCGRSRGSLPQSPRPLRAPGTNQAAATSGWAANQGWRRGLQARAGTSWRAIPLPPGPGLRSWTVLSLQFEFLLPANSIFGARSEPEREHPVPTAIGFLWPPRLLKASWF